MTCRDPISVLYFKVLMKHSIVYYISSVCKLVGKPIMHTDFPSNMKT